MSVAGDAERQHLMLLRASHCEFRQGHPQAALDLLEPVLLSDEQAQSPSTFTALLWALAGDCYFQIGKSENGFIVYRKALELDPMCGCLALFAREVARHGRGEDAEFALKCLDDDRRAQRQAWREHFFHVLRHSLSFSIIWFRCISIPWTQRKLRRLAVEFRTANRWDLL